MIRMRHTQTREWKNIGRYEEVERKVQKLHKELQWKMEEIVRWHEAWLWLRTHEERNIDRNPTWTTCKPNGLTKHL